MQYATMVDLLRDAEIAGAARTEYVNERLADAFDIWLSEQDLGEITGEEEDALRGAFEKGLASASTTCLPTGKTRSRACLRPFTTVSVVDGSGQTA